MPTASGPQLTASGPRPAAPRRGSRPGATTHCLRSSASGLQAPGGAHQAFGPRVFGLPPPVRSRRASAALVSGLRPWLTVRCLRPSVVDLGVRSAAVGLWPAVPALGSRAHGPLSWGYGLRLTACGHGSRSAVLGLRALDPGLGPPGLWPTGSWAAAVGPALVCGRPGFGLRPRHRDRCLRVASFGSGPWRAVRCLRVAVFGPCPWPSVRCLGDGFPGSCSAASGVRSVAFG